MTVSELDVPLRVAWQVTGTPGNLKSSFSASLPPVPAGQIWAGTLTLVPINPTAAETLELQRATWTLYREQAAQVPLIQWTGGAVVTGVRLDGLNVLTVTGTPQPGDLPATTMQLRFIGYAYSDGDTGPQIWPALSASALGAVQVFTSGSPGGVPSVDPLPGRGNPSTVSAASATPASTTTLMSAPAQAPAYIWELQLSGTLSQLTTVSGAQGCTVYIKTHNAGTILHRLALATIPGSAVADSNTIPLHGYQVAPSDGLDLAITGTSASAVTGNATCVYST